MRHTKGGSLTGLSPFVAPLGYMAARKVAEEEAARKAAEEEAARKVACAPNRRRGT